MEAEKWIEEEGDAVPKDKAEFMPRLVARIYQSLKTDTEEEKMVLQVYEGHHVLPIQPFLLNEYARGLYSVFTLGIFRQIIAGIYPHDYLKSSDGSSYRATMRRWCSNRRFFVTAGKGYFGLGPISTEAGDAIYLLEGSAVPFILKKNTDGTYRIVGECYLQGIMHGEALEKEGFVWENIEIS